jgi:hypothetical protein
MAGAPSSLRCPDPAPQHFFNRSHRGQRRGRTRPAGEHRYGLVTIGHTLYSFGYQTSGDLAERCGRQSTLLLGIDKDTGSGYLYAVSHANGTATIIQSLGKVPANFTDPAYFRFWLNTLDSSSALFGE